MKPNLFAFATSELSQDAFLCWLLSWSEEKYKQINHALYQKSREFIKYLLNEDFFDDNYLIANISINRQFKNIDFIAEINDELVLLFEDKIKTKNHSNQLVRYSEIINKEYKNYKIYKYYIKSDLVWPSEKNEIIENDYILVDIFNISEIFKPGINNSIYDDFALHINNKLNQYKNYKFKKTKEWGQMEWFGFLYDLAPITGISFFDKHYAGETFWFVFRWREDVFREKCHLSLEINTKELVIKTHVYDNRINKRKYRESILYKILEAFKNYDITKVNSMGKSMTLIKINNFISSDKNEIINISKTIGNINSIISIFEKIK